MADAYGAGATTEAALSTPTTPKTPHSSLSLSSSKGWAGGIWARKELDTWGSSESEV